MITTFKRGQDSKSALNVGITSTHKPATKKEIKEFVRMKLGTSKTWAQRALLKIFEFQTADEQAYGSTYVDNGVGFTGADAEFLTSLAEGLKKYNRLSPKQMTFLYRKMPKYWKQIIKISDEEQLEEMVRKARV